MNGEPEFGADHMTYAEWVEDRLRKITREMLSISREDFIPYIDVQVRAAIQQARRHGRSGRGDDEPVAL